MEPAPVKSTVPVPDSEDVPVKFKFAVDVNVPPKAVAVSPIVIDELASEVLGTEETFNSILLFVIAVVIPEPPTISKLSPKPTL